MDSSIAKAERLTQLRKLAKLGRNDIAQMAGVSVLTYKGWENAKFGGIPLKRASSLVELFQIEGIRCSVDWIMHGTGEPPKKILLHQTIQFQNAITNATQQPPEIIEQLQIKAELEFFRNNNEAETMSLTLPDDAMEPCFLQGDLVAGTKVPLEYADKTIGLNCIVRTKNNKVLLRQIQTGSDKISFTLLCLNSNSKQQFILHDVELIDIAPVIWIRRTAISLPRTHHKT